MRRSQPQRSSWRNYAVLSALLLSLFVIGARLGNIVLASQSQAGLPTGADDKPSGSAIVNPPFQVNDFVLTNQIGAPLSLKALRGRAVMLFFGYTHCPDVCPATLAVFTQVKKSLGVEAERIAFVFVTLDSKRDTPEVLKDYLNRFDPEFIGLTGDEMTLRRMTAEYGAIVSSPVDQSSDENDKHHHEEGIGGKNYLVQHSSPAYLIDPQGFLRMVYFDGTAPSGIANGIRQILQEAS